MEEDTLSVISKLSSLTGCTEAALRLFLSILAGYPIAFVHRNTLYGKPPGIQHIFFTTVGLCLGYLNFGLDIFHTTAMLLIVYLVLKTIGGTLHSVIITLLFTMTYLLIGYCKTETESYDIIWTMPHCILVLRLSGLAFDIYDGSFPDEKLSKDSKKLALREVPSLLEIAGFSYFPTSFLVGPQFPMKRYQDFISGKLKHNSQDSLPNCVAPAVKVFGLGVLYIFIYFFGTSYFSEEYLLGQKFLELSFINRILFLGVWGHLTLQKYIGIWLLSEGACILIGLTYNGPDEDGKPKWDGCSNANIKVFELAQNFIDYIDSFNINTNYWVFQYIYKRLKFLGNKYLSQIGVLLFLTLWHGFHSGYFVCFGMEFMVVIMEKDLQSILQKNKVFLQFLARPGVREIKWIILKFYTIVFMGPCIAPLALRSFENWWFLYKNTYFFAQLFWGTWFFYKPIVKALLPPQRAHVD